MEISWIYLIGIAIVICATIGLVAGKLDAKDFIYIIGLVLSFLSGSMIEKYKMKRGL
jgi:type IV secretory pathway VirB2 component (pilin)